MKVKINRKFYILLSILIVLTLLFIVCKKYKIGKLLQESNNNISANLAKAANLFTEKPILRIKFVNFNTPIEYLPMLNDILTEKYDIVKVKEGQYDMVLFGPDGEVQKDGKLGLNSPKEKDEIIKIFYTFESATPKVENFDLSIGFDHIEHPNYIRVPLYYVFFKDKISYNFNRGTCKPNKKRFASFLVTNAAENNNWLNGRPFDGGKARVRLFHKLSLYKKVDSGGTYLNNTGGPIPIGENWKDTMEWLGQGKFTISYENQKSNGYITEKPFLSHIAGSIPIYYADKTAITDINKNAVIYADDFASEDELVEYIKKVDNDDELYCKIWNEPIINDPSKDYRVIKEKLSKKLYEVIDKKLNLKK